MAELHNVDTGSVSTGLSENNVPQVMDSDSLLSSLTAEGGSGSQISEVNNDQSMNIMSISNVSNNFQNNSENSSDISSPETSLIKTSECGDSETEETDRNNLKNRQLAQENSNACKDQDKNLKNSANLHNGQNKGSNLSRESQNKQGKKRRGIRFPKDTFISSYFEPPDPWKNAPSWTTDDLIAAYRKSCETHGTKPIVKVLQQLHAISTPGKREESLTLKGEKLDQKQVECIEEILRRVQFQLVDLEGSHLDDECAVALFDMIEHYESACQLNISSNRNIGARGWQACSRLVRRTPTLNYLDMRNCDLNERTIPIFGRALKMGCHLTILHMENMGLSGRPLMILVAALKMNETLHELFLAENKLMPTDGVQLEHLMRYNHKLNLLDLRKNLLQDIGVSHLCDGLVEQVTGYGLRTLVLWNNQISYQAMPSLSRVLAVSQNLETLNIGHNNITNEGVHLLKDGLLKTTSLLRIGLQGTGVSDEGAVALAEFIADSLMLLRIDLRDNEIKTGGLMALSHAMRVNSSVTRIDLDQDTKKESVIKDYAEQQSRLLRDILTFQQRNIQTATEREDQERARLEQLAIDSAIAREKKAAEQDAENLPTSNIGSFTVISEENLGTEEQPERPDASDTQKDVNFDKEEAVSISNTNPTIPSDAQSEEEHHSPANHRPNLLIPRRGLQPQESLDSPQPNLSNSENAQPEGEVTPTKSSNHPNLPLVMPEGKLLPANTPAEMLLSPQYYPKQLARKIFSVTHVNEDLSTSSALPSSDTYQNDFDPLGLCKVQFASTSSTEPLSASGLASSSNTESSSSLSTESSIAHLGDRISPTMLVRDLADETVKQVVIGDEGNSSDSSEDTTTASHLTCLSSETAASFGDASPPLDCSEVNSTEICFPVGSREVDCDSKLSSSKPEEMLETVDTIALPSEQIDANSKVPQISSTPSGNEMNSDEESSHLEVASKDARNSVCIEETQNGVTSVMNCDKTLNENPEKNECDSSNMGVPDVNEKQSIANSHDDLLTGDFTQKNTSLPMSSACNSRVENVDGTASTDMLPSVSSKELQSQDSSLRADKSTLVINAEKSHASFSEPESSQDVDKGGLAIEEEPWTAVGEDDPKVEIANQPDFFTTLSMNGLTQELASALTSEEDTDMKPQDEFERELEAMLAESDIKTD